MNCIKARWVKPASMLALTALGLLIVGAARAEEATHLTITQPGGMPGQAVMTGIEKATNGVTVTWDGPSGYYQLFQKAGLIGGTWQPVGTPSIKRKATVSAAGSNVFFRVAGPAAQFAGSAACAECHENIHSTEMLTRHASALVTLQQAHQDTNPSCLPCHTVGYGLPSGFTSAAATPTLAGVQCENCHGAAANHAANPDDFAARPRVELAAQVCGGCHTGSHHPTYDEWKSSGHAFVTEDMSPASRVNSCGRCHSGSARLTLLHGGNALSVTNDANVAITCAVCHDPHAQRPWTNILSGVITTNQLRNPVASTNDYFLSTSDVFTNKYNPNINLCAQCHNHRGATWTSSSRPPHHSPQYNILLGSVGELASGPATYSPSTHALQIEKQCVGCHMPTEEYLSEALPAVTGHSFRVESFQSCLECHPFMPELLVEFTAFVVTNRMQEVKGYLDQWALQQAPAEIQKYGVRAWEYDNAGGLSTPDPDGTLRGPVSSTNAALDEQKYIPTNIKKARYNLYLVLHDGSRGVHNPQHTITLLETARDWVLQELAE